MTDADAEKFRSRGEINAGWGPRRGLRRAQRPRTDFEGSLIPTAASPQGEHEYRCENTEASGLAQQQAAGSSCKANAGLAHGRPGPRAK
ncbi:Hypothetical predicted protein, partial [Marmota monax]